MPLETDLSAAPYFDDHTPSKNFHKILFKPTVAVQTRELNQLQTLVQEQIERFGNNIFKRGTILDGVNFIFHDKYPYIKIKDTQVNGQLTIPENYVGFVLKNESNLTAMAINYEDGFESTDPDLKTLYVRYINSGESYNETEFSGGQILTAYDTNNSIHSVEINTSGSGYSNSDVIVFTPVLLVNVNSGSITVGDSINDPITNTHGVVVSTEDKTNRLAKHILPGTVEVNSDSNVVGTSTSFASDFANGDYISIYSNTTSYDTVKINVVSNNTFMNLTSNVSFANVSATYANTTDSQVYVKYRPRAADLTNAAANSSMWEFTAGNTVVGNTASDVFEIIDVVGENAAAGVTTNSAGRISIITMTNLGNGYIKVPYASIKSTVGSGGVVTPRNYFGQITVSTAAGSVGDGYAFEVTEGLIYQKGYSVRVDPQVIVVEKYSRNPDGLAVGFSTSEEIINSNLDSSLLDNSTGESNETAPGADRLKLVANLEVREIDAAESDAEFFHLVEWAAGFPYKQNTRTFYNVINDQIAERTKEGHGDFVTDRFLVTTTTPSNSALVANTVTVVVDPGTSYIDGYRVETVTNFATNSSKSVDTEIVTDAKVSLNYENYLRVNEVGGMFEFDRANEVDLYDTAKGFLSNTAAIALGNVAPNGNKIGTARARNFVYEQNTPGSPNAVYRLYLFDIKMNPGMNFRNVRAVHQSGVSHDGIADVVLTVDPTTNTSVAALSGKNNSLIFPAGFTSPLNANNISYVYRTIDEEQDIANTGIITVSLSGSPNKTFPYTGTLSDSQKNEIYLAPSANLIAQANLTGSVNVSSSSANVTGNATAFLSELNVGQYININGGTSNNVIVRVTSITNNTLLTVSSNVSFTDTNITPKLAWPAHVPIQLAYNNNYTVNVTSSDTVMNIDLGDTLNTASNTGVVIAYNVQNDAAAPTVKTPNRNLLVKLHLANNEAGTTGPWCLGVPDIFRLRRVYKGTSTVNTASTDVTDQFFIDSNQNANYYNLGYLYKKKTTPSVLTDDDYLLVEFDAFTTDPGFYTVTSYVSSSKATRFTEDSKPLSDLSDTVNTFEIPEIWDDSGKYYDLIDNIDFRPYVDATANITANSELVTLNPNSSVTFDSSDRYFPVPDSIYTHDIEFFLARIDSVAIDKSGKVKVYNGTAGIPKVPEIPNGTMRLNDVLFPSYPSLPEMLSEDVRDMLYTGVYSNKYNGTRINSKKIRTLFNDVDFDREQPKNHTMVDIGALTRRVEDLEYYVKLNSIQSQLKDRVIPSSVSPNIDRFKYGFFIDDYDDEEYSEIESPEYNATVISGFATPALTSFNVVHTGDPTSSPYTEVELVKQPIATETPPVVPPPPTKYVGMMIIEPPYFKSQSYTITTTTTSTAKKKKKKSGKILCTAMNEAYGFGSFRNAIWIEHGRNMDDRYEMGYHALFLPVVDYLYKSDKKDTAVARFIRRISERVVRKRTADLWKARRGKMDLEGRIYRTILEPLCFVAGTLVDLKRRLA